MKKDSKTPSEGGAVFTIGNRFVRLCWGFVWIVACAWTPPALWRWRSVVLRCFGAKIGTPCDVRGSARVWYPANLIMADRSILAERVNCYNVSNVEIGSCSVISQGAYICTAGHDVHVDGFPLVSRNVVIGEQCWIASEAFLGPGVTVGEGAVLGARAVAFKDLKRRGIYAGNPARLVRQRSSDVSFDIKNIST